ncbi:hypothetical protein H9651_09015 [Microbacterium sp. Sa4CUA7]|uniref:Uncharacterized protein n=1 Tax=Microbacterium pullorum TaxID=2762236 RepID=A0ABR8S2Q6_9MICO|nr:hypothetical protein [Microbacterium pullorum]MBD7957778.1 hypothetical protein [Microbacterium pullorum]
MVFPKLGECVLSTLHGSIQAESLAERAMCCEAVFGTRDEAGVFAEGGGHVHIEIGLTPIQRALRDGVAAENRRQEENFHVWRHAQEYG